MATARQIAANRANAKKSTGPKTEEGKAQVKLNAWRHGLTGQVALMPEEDREAFNKFCAELTASLNPANAMERQLAQSVAQDTWRLNRMRAMEDNILALGHSRLAAEFDTSHPEIRAALIAAQVYSEDPHQFQLLTLYIQRTNRDIHRNMQLLRDLQAERRANRLAALEEATRVKQWCDREKLEYDPTIPPKIRAAITGDTLQPAVNGFVFSTEEIDAFALHQRIREQARLLAFPNPLRRTRAA